MSAELDASYQVLQDRIGRLTDELVEARSQRIKELAEKERLANRLALLMNELPGGVVVIGGDGVIREANHAASTLLGCSLVSKNWQAVLAELIDQEPPSASELVLKNGRRLSLNRQHLRDVDEEVVLLTDLTQAHALQEAVNREQRLAALGEMAARLAHQIRTPLSSALLFAGHLGHAGVSAEQRERVTKKMIGSLRHMESLVDGMLNFVRGGRMVSKMFSVQSLGLDLVQAIEPIVAEVAGELRYQEAVPTGARLAGDREAILSAVLNLVDNAKTMVAEHLILSLNLTAAKDKLLITVTDNGPGIPEAIQDRVFDPFYTTRDKGTGIGLAVVAMTVRDHGGQIKLASVEGEGCCFVIELPLAFDTQDSVDLLESGEPVVAGFSQAS